MSPVSSQLLKYSKAHNSFAYSDALLQLPVEALAFAVAGVIASIFKFKASSALFGISIGLCTTMLAAKAINLYNPELMIGVAKKTCQMVRKFPRLQLISFIFSVMISIPFKKLGFFAGILDGAFGAIILDIEKYKQLRKAK